MLQRNAYFFKPKNESMKEAQDEIESLTERIKGTITRIPLDTLFAKDKETLLDLLQQKQYKKTTDYLENILSSSNDEGLIKRLNSVSKQLSKILKLEKPKNE